MCDKEEPLLNEEGNRFTFFPIVHHDIYELYKKHKSTHWSAEEIDFSQDREDWKKLKEEERLFLTNILSFFAASDGIVLENLASRFYKEIKLSEARAFYAYQIGNEQEHAETYSVAIDTLITDEKEKQIAFNAIYHMNAVKLKAEWAIKWIDSSDNFATRLIAFAIVEGIFFQSAFMGILWFAQQKNLLPGLRMSNRLISKDEALHTTYACLLYVNHIKNKISYEQLKEMVTEAVEIEKEFNREILAIPLLGLNSDDLENYVLHCADTLVSELGYPVMFKASAPIEFIKLLTLEKKDNFFERRSSEYSKVSGLTTDEVLDKNYEMDF